MTLPPSSCICPSRRRPVKEVDGSATSVLAGPHRHRSECWSRSVQRTGFHNTEWITRNLPMVGASVQTYEAALKVLGLAKDTIDEASAKQAYRTLALRYHPDKCTCLSNAEATVKFQQASP